MALETYVCTNDICKQKNTVDVIGEPQKFIRDTCSGCSKNEEVKFVLNTESQQYFYEQSQTN